MKPGEKVSEEAATFTLVGMQFSPSPGLGLRPGNLELKRKGRPVLKFNRKSKSFEEEHTLKKGQLERIGNNLGASQEAVAGV